MEQVQEEEEVAAESSARTAKVYQKFWEQHGRPTYEAVMKIFSQDEEQRLKGNAIMEALVREKFSENQARLAVHVAAKKGLLVSEGFGPNHRYRMGERIWDRLNAMDIVIQAAGPRRRRDSAGGEEEGVEPKNNVYDKFKKAVDRLTWDKFAENYIREKWGARPFEWESVKSFVKQLLPEPMWDEFARRWIEKQA